MVNNAPVVVHFESGGVVAERSRKKVTEKARRVFRGAESLRGGNGRPGKPPADLYVRAMNEKEKAIKIRDVRVDCVNMPDSCCMFAPITAKELQ